jgi:hypothetical protein
VGFIEGFVAEVNHRLHDARRAAVAAAEATAHAPRQDAVSWAPQGQSEPPTSLALVLVAKAKRVDQEFKVRHPHSRTVYSQVRLQSWSGYAPGRAAGRRANLARGSVGGSRGALSA